jgi:hypothetical protein
LALEGTAKASEHQSAIAYQDGTADAATGLLGGKE